MPRFEEINRTNTSANDRDDRNIQKINYGMLLKYIEVLGLGVPKQSEGGHCTSKKGNKRFVSGVTSRVRIKCESITKT